MSSATPTPTAAAYTWGRRPTPTIPSPHSSSNNYNPIIGRGRGQTLAISAMATEPLPSAAGTKRVVVCGGGVIGACTAYFLSSFSSKQPEATETTRPPVHVTLVEKSSVACAASGKAGGFLALDWCDGGPLSNLARASFHLHRSLARDLDGPSTYGYRPLDTLSFSLLPAEDVRRKKPAPALLPSWIDGPARHARTIGTVDTTAQVHPQLFTRRLVFAAVESGVVDVVTGEVESVEIEGGRAVGVSVRAASGEAKVIEADAVVLAMGPWSSRSPLVSSLFQVSGLKAHSVVLRPRDPAAITPHALFLSFIPSAGAKALDPEVYPRPTGEVYICGMSKEAEVLNDPEEIAGEPESIAMLHKIAGTVSSHLVAGEEGAEVVAEQACFLPCTEDGLPVIGEIPGAEGCYVATGHSCWGILNGPATGAALAELILDGCATLVDLTPFSPARFLPRE